MKTRSISAVGLCCAATLAVAAPGELDSTFGDGGLVRVDVGTRNDRAAGLFVQPDGSLLIGRVGGSDDFSVVRLASNGALDVTFAADGSAAAEIVGAAPTSAVIQQRDGNVVVAARHSLDGWHNVALARYLADGRLDTGFGARGVASAGLQSRGIEPDVALIQQSDGRLVAAASAAGILAVRFDAAGTLDPSFGGAGIAHFDPSGSGASGVRWLAGQPDGRLLLAGFSGSDLAVVRLTADGAPDASFGGGGVAILSELDAVSSAEAVAVQSDGAIVVAGVVCEAADSACDAGAETVLYRLKRDGSPDMTFGTAGRSAVKLDGWSRIEVARGGLAIAADGTIVVAGRAGRASAEVSRVPAPTYGFVARIGADGVLDAGFGARGVTVLDTGRYTPPLTELNGLALFADGSIATAMTTETVYSYEPTIVAARLAAKAGSPGVIGLATAQVTVREGTDARFIVQRTGGSAGIATVGYEAYICWDWFSCADMARDGDFVATKGTLTWPDGDTEDRIVAIPIVADHVVEDRETLSLALSGATGARLGVADSWLEIVDWSDGPSLLQPRSTVVSASEADGEAQLWVSRTGGIAGAVTVRYSTTGLTATPGVDFTPVTGILQWADGEWTDKLIRIPIADDGAAEIDETFQVTLSDPSQGVTIGAPFALVVIGGRPSVLPVDGGGGAVGIFEVAYLALPLVCAFRRRSRLSGPQNFQIA